MRDFKGGVLHDIDSSSDLLQSWTRCDLLMVLLDVEKIQRQGVGLHDDLRDLSSVLVRDEMRTSEKRLAIVVTQADKAGFTHDRHSPADAERFVAERLPAFSDRVRQCGFREVRCFALASIGSQPEECEDGGLQVAEKNGRREWRPFGYEEVFDWLCEFRRADRRRVAVSNGWRRAKPCVVAFFVLAIAFVGWQRAVACRRQSAVSVYDDPTSTWEMKADATWRMGERDLSDKMDTRISEYDDQSGKLAGGSDDKALRELLVDNRRFFKNARVGEEGRNRIREIDHRVESRLEDICLERIHAAMESNDYALARELVGRYWADREISKLRDKEVREIDETLQTSERRLAKRDIANYDVGEAGNTARMRERISRILAFNYPTEKEREEAEKAADAMERLLSGEFSISMIVAKGLAEERDTYVFIAADARVNSDLADDYENGDVDPVKTKNMTTKECSQ